MKTGNKDVNNEFSRTMQASKYKTATRKESSREVEDVEEAEVVE
jgi:hypothetical protein